MTHPPPDPERPVPVPVMYQEWNWLTFLHWAYDPAVLRSLVPPPLELDTFDGAAWVGITPFLMENLRAPGLPAVPWLSRAPETNVRTYVRAPDGQRGIWFFSLDHARLLAVTFARATYFLPYMWSSMSFRRRGPRVAYRARRRWPGAPASYDIAVDVGDPLSDREVGERDHFLTARWVLYTFYGSVLARARVEHPRWPLHRGRVVRLRQTLLSAAGLPEPTAEPLVHFSPGVSTRIGPPRLSAEADTPRPA
ncbi:MAG TPA: DUF2071 domain-containing protein [Actinomycetota bacterium]|nr:DUF2071 domain-containing protein [Actinomycetota bacterium]